ncbi:unnamed protein product [Haemonchus placei]|uniref:RanBD1 domain-containing protein n=1 Tax=Haemonchus placei TaxID=6290 RepID=A0A0N4VY63_HAEPC|nr:unnamed protein product [Haemonchus placei]
MLVSINESKRVGAESEAIFKKIDDLPMTEKLGDSVTCGAFLRRKTAKTMKFIEYCDLIRIRAVRIILNSEDERILVIVVRNPTKDAEWCVQIVYPDDMINQFLMKLVEEVDIEFFFPNPFVCVS